MREMIHTIPVNEAFESGDECPFCYLERKTEQSTIRYIAGPGASYMEPDVRLATDETGFCVHHMKLLYDYGNTLGNALMLQTYMARQIENFQKGMDAFQTPPRKTLIPRKKQPRTEIPFYQRIGNQVKSCYICDRMNYNMERYLQTFFVLLKEPEFRAKVEASKGFCMRHFSQLLEYAEKYLPNSQRDWFYEKIFPLMLDNLVRVKKDLDWFVAKHDYRYAGSDWKNSQDAVPRTMQKLEGLHPSDPIYRSDR